MANRQQRRAAAKNRPGENYADVLHKQQLIKEAVEKSAHDHAVSLEADIKSQRLMWMSVIALNKAFGLAESGVWITSRLWMKSQARLRIW